MKKILLIFLFSHFSFLICSAQYDLLSAKKGVIKGNYNFWVYTPEEYYYTQESTLLSSSFMEPVSADVTSTGCCAMALLMPLRWDS